MSRLDILKSLPTSLVMGMDLDSEMPFLTSQFQYGNGDSITLFAEIKQNAVLLHDAGLTANMLLATERELTDARVELIHELCASYEVTFASQRIEAIATAKDVERKVRDLLQAIIRADVLRLERQRHRRNDLEIAFEDLLRAKRRFGAEVSRRWTDEQVDPENLYPVDYHLNSAVRPCNIFLVQSDSKSTYTSAASGFFRSAGVDIPTLAIFEKTPNVAQKNIKRVSRVVDELVFGIQESAKRIASFIES